MPPGAPRSFGAQLKTLREAAGFTQEELATIAGLSVHAVSALCHASSLAGAKRATPSSPTARRNLPARSR